MTMKRFFTLFLIVMAGQYVLCAHAFSFNAVCLQHNFTQKEVSDTVQTNKNEKPVKLSGVTIEATRVIQKPDGQLIFHRKRNAIVLQTDTVCCQNSVCHVSE